MSGRLTQEFVDAPHADGEYSDGPETKLVFVVSAGGKRRQYRVSSGFDVPRSAERVGAASMYSLEQARARAARILRELADGETYPGSLPIGNARARGEVRSGGDGRASVATALFFNGWVRGRQTAT